MLGLSPDLPAHLAPRPTRGSSRAAPPADGLYHDDKLNMGPAIWLAVTLSLIGWGAIIGAVHLIRPLI